MVLEVTGLVWDVLLRSCNIASDFTRLLAALCF